MIKQLKSTITHHITNSRGWRTDRKLIVIESDDWGSIRMPNKPVYHKLLQKGIRVDLCPYNKYDTLANVQDFDALFSTLEKHTDFKNNNPIITLNTNVANPNFDRIKSENFEKYYFEEFLDTLKEYYPQEDVFGMWKEGMSKGFIFPQLHGREHVNSNIWLDLIRNGNTHLLYAFELKLFGLSLITSNQIKVPYLAALIYNSEKGKKSVEKSIIEGADIFERIFDFRSKSFIAPLYTWASELEEVFHEAGVKYIQGADRHKIYDFTKRSYARKHHIIGKKNQYNQIYLHRNCTFEPTILSKKDNIKECLKNIETAFFWKKPAVISMHRLNFIGSLEESNRTQNLKQLDILLTRIMKRWNDVEFIHSSELGDLIETPELL
jgi:hypothetical protein